jgi:hypothetical protein
MGQSGSIRPNAPEPAQRPDTLAGVPDLDDSLGRARRERDVALQRGDERAAAVIARAIEVLEHAAAGHIPRQRASYENSPDGAAS